MEQMNRETKRRLQRAGQLEADGSPGRGKERTLTRPAPKPKEQRTKPLEFLREVRVELRKVAWPTRQETITYSMVVLVTLIVLTAMIFGLDYVCGKLILFLIK